MEGLPESLRRQDKFQDALVLEQQVARDCVWRGLPQNAAIPQILELNASGNRDHVECSPPSLRLMY